MTFAGFMRYLLGSIITLSVLTGYIGAIGYGIYWWNRIYIDFPYFGGEYLKFFVYLTLTWGIPGLFILLLLISVIFDCCKEGNLISSFASGISIICLIAGLLGVTPFFVSRSTKHRSNMIWNSPRNQLPSNIQEKLNNWINKQTAGMSEADKQKFITKFDTVEYRINEPREIFLYFVYLQLGSAVLEIFLVIFETCK
ncbi:hypothetical protein TVAG_090910 [Trichomonas vaginalis G3]|uniref:Uncharacterized protein n=1 Tax=Trichomonas vaginalis (strain ATCC PRA-98 / G3) TaxID=412133 RepID=A2F927_TRIV3|nr:hypothetical protein TVAGG3_0828090 [Trichomonas vaginalis G3]EAX98602.1 hypothetical protein TVAG_090910 [Trichomonas vaginalis G3]KAI5498391.1 hypothetical protein TVAGG3_0828090 [Trichomonas vaginalis G3]|eukprot:XP_001311532.1 hypothetical protein [Trichomonas vaginalis G3]